MEEYPRVWFRRALEVAQGCAKPFLINASIELRENLVRALFLICFLFLSLPLNPSAHADTLYGKVVGVDDGDTITVLSPEKAQRKVRLAEIDAPESKQPYGARAKEKLSALVFGKEVSVEVRDIDRYERIVGRASVGGVDVSAEMVKEGAAWVYEKYAQDKALFALQEQAQAGKIGLWALNETQRIAPWEWRNEKRSSVALSHASQESATSKCLGKRFCKQMSNCAEARFYLQSCGVSRLDGDGDGVPCESLCR